MRWSTGALALALLVASGGEPALAQHGEPAAVDPIRGPALAARFAFAGQVQARHARDIAANAWSIGAEAQDRDYSTYEAWRAYLGPLGAKGARLQSGWARTDKGGGVYDYAWLDPVVDGMLADGVQPWLSLSYGNPAYEGGGRGARDSALPTGAGRVAWLAYVKATAERYRGRIKEYEIWNEPDLIASITAEAYGEFAYETAMAIKAADPSAGVILGAFAGSVWSSPESWEPSARAQRSPREFARASLERFVALGGRGLATAVTYHAYNPNPDAVYAHLDGFRDMVRAIDPGIQVRQGENGAPSLNQQHYALRNEWWTEESQAKWLLRRMLGDVSRGVPTSMFTMTEMHYPVAAETNLAFVGRATNLPPAASSTKHFKGLLETRLYAPGTPEDDRTVVRTKMAYPAMQAVTAVFDSRLQPIDGGCSVTGTEASVAVHAFRRDDGAALIALWRNGDKPGDRPVHEAVSVSCSSLPMTDGASYVDLLTRATYRTTGLVRAEGGGFSATDVPIYDSPVLIADPRLVVAR